MHAELARGDLRALYLGWLVIAQGGELDDAAVEPPVPSGLGRLGSSLNALADFLCVDRDLLEVAAQASADQIGRWVATLPAAEKDRMLTKLVADRVGRIALLELWQRCRDAHRDDSSAALESRRSVRGEGQVVCRLHNGGNWHQDRSKLWDSVPCEPP